MSKADPAFLRRLEQTLSTALGTAFEGGEAPVRPLTALIEALQEIDRADADGDGMVSEEERAALAEHELLARDSGLDKRTIGLAVTGFANRCTMSKSPPPELPAGAPLKKVLFVIDVQDGYDAEFVGSLPSEAPGGLSYIKSLHPVRQSHELVSKRLITNFAPGEKSLRFDKVWNRGLDGEAFGRVCKRVVAELQSRAYDFVVFTSDYLERADGEEKGVFALDETPWTDPAKPVALVAYSHFLTFSAGGLGTNVSRRIRSALPEVTNSRGAEGNEVCGVPCLYLRKQVDDAFDDAMETSDRTFGQVGGPRRAPAHTAQPRNRVNVQPRCRVNVQPRNRVNVQPRSRVSVQPRNRVSVQPRNRPTPHAPRPHAHTSHNHHRTNPAPPSHPAQPWLDNIDVCDNGLPKPRAETLLQKLTRLGFGPGQARFVSGVGFGGKV